MSGSNKYLLPTIISLVVLAQAGVDLYLPSFPAIVETMHVPASYIQGSLSIFLFSMAISQLFSGALSDAWGRRRVIVPAILIYVLGSIACTLAPDIGLFMVGRILQGFAAGACVVVARAVGRDAYDGEELARVTVSLSVAWALVPMIAPVVGGYVQEYAGWRLQFLILTLLGVGFYVLVSRCLPETRKGKAEAFELTAMVASIGTLLRNRYYIGYSLVPALLFSQTTAYMTVSPILFQNKMGLSPSAYGHVIMVTALFYLAGNFLNKRLIKRFPAQTLVRAGLYVCMAAAGALLLFSALGVFNLWVIVIPFCVSYFASGIVFANSITLALTPFSERAGIASALLGCFQIMAGCGSSALMALSFHSTQAPLALYLVCCMAFAIVSVRLIVRPAEG